MAEDLPRSTADDGSTRGEHAGDDTHDRLQRERAAASARWAALEATRADVIAASSGTNADDEHDPDGATIGFERAQLQALAERAHAHLVAVDAALARLSAGTYGCCERCEQPIAPARLAVRPTATTCVRCAR